MKKLYILLIIAFVLQLAVRAEAISLELSCNLKPDGTACDNSGIYTLKAVDFVNVSGVAVVIQYDNATFKSPAVTTGPLIGPNDIRNKKINVINPSFTENSLKIVCSSILPGNGTLATIKFTPGGDVVGSVSIKSSDIVDQLGVKLPHTIKNPSDFFVEATAAVETQTGAAANAAAHPKNLNVSSSNPSGGVSMAISPSDNAGKGNGTTQLVRIFSDGASVTVTAPSTAGGNNFSSWSGCDRFSGVTCYVTMDAAKTVTALYAAPPADTTKQNDTASTTDTTKKTDTSSNATTQTTPVTPSQADLDAAARYAAELRAQADAAAAAATAARANAAGASVTVVGGASVGTVTLPSDQMASTDRKTEYQPLVTDLRGDMTIPLSGGESAAQAAGDQQPAKDKMKQENRSASYKSVLQLFREFSGEKSVKTLIALFAEGAVPNFSQVPPVALSDGITPVRLTLTLKQGGNETPKFILQGASVQQMSSEGEDQATWTIDALPKKGVHEAKLTVIDGQVIMEFPLVVTPSIGPLVPKAQKFTEADFTLYLSNPAKFDLNKDEKFDSLDDYIFTANYIAALKIRPEKLKKDEPKPAVQGEAKGKEAQKPKEEKTKKVPSP